MNKFIIPIITVLIIAAGIGCAPRLTDEYVKDRITSQFNKTWGNVSDGCGLIGIKDLRRTFIGYSATIEYSCGFRPKPKVETKRIYISPRGSVHGIPDLRTPILYGNKPAIKETIPVEDTCTKEKDEILGVINTFETLQIDHGGEAADRILKMFTPPETPDDASVYDFLTGSDLGVLPRLYSSGQTDFEEPSYKILGMPRMNSSGTCTVKVEEQRRYWKHGIGTGFGPLQSFIVYFAPVKQGNEWKIDRYFSDTSSHKFGGWGY